MVHLFFLLLVIVSLITGTLGENALQLLLLCILGGASCGIVHLAGLILVGTAKLRFRQGKVNLERKEDLHRFTTSRAREVYEKQKAEWARSAEQVVDEAKALRDLLGTAAPWVGVLVPVLGLMIPELTGLLLLTAAGVLAVYGRQMAGETRAIKREIATLMGREKRPERLLGNG